MVESRFRFSRSERLHKRSEFLGVYERGDRIHALPFVLYISENNLPCHRLGLTVSRKVGGPVVRNQIKRRLREIFRKNKEAITPCCDLVINARKAAAGSSYQKLEQEFLRALGRWVENKKKT